MLVFVLGAVTVGDKHPRTHTGGMVQAQRSRAGTARLDAKHSRGHNDTTDEQVFPGCVARVDCGVPES
jgi:hypothetical protein